MLATQAETDLVTPVLRTVPVALAEPAADEDDDDFAPARGLALGAALGMFSIGIVGGLGWWLL